MSDTTELIKERLPVAEFVGQYVSLSPAGKNLKGLCPFHKEKTPSFIVSPDRQIWHCFGCSAGGDVIGFLMRYENLEFFEALKILAEKTGIEIKNVSSSDQRQYAVLYEINQSAENFFKSNLHANSAVAESARNYLKERGLKKEIIDEFNLGLALNSSDALERHLLKTGFKMSDIEKAGLVFKTERGTYWDRFRSRIMFPLHNQFGKTVGFTGRTLNEQRAGSEEEKSGLPADGGLAAAKYINSPETPVFNKSRLLFGLNKAKSAIRDARSAVLVEGQMDFLMAWQDGVKNTIASSGTSFTGEQLKNLKRLADTLVIAFDNDEAGQIASERVIDIASGEDFTVKIISAPANLKDPADVVNFKPGLFKELTERAELAMNFYFRRYLKAGGDSNKSAPKDISNLKRNLRIVLGKVKAIASPVEQSHWVGELARLVNISETHLFEEMRGLKPEKMEIKIIPAGGRNESFDTEEFSRKDKIAQRLISVALIDDAYRKKISKYLEFLPEDYRFIADSISDKTKILPVRLSKLFDFITLRSGMEIADPKTLNYEFEQLGKQLQLEHFQELRQSLIPKIKTAEASGGQDYEALKEVNRISMEIDRIHKETYNT